MVRLLRWGLGLVIVLAISYSYLATLHPHERVPNHAIFDREDVWAIAHRGGRGLWPENTQYAFEQAEALGVDVLEMDLRVTSDGFFVVLHDSTVDRTTNGSGRVEGMTLTELSELDAGYRFQDATGGFPFRDQGLKVPVFEEVLSQFPGSLLNIEMKQFTPDLAARLCRLLQNHSATGRVLVASFGHEEMVAFRKACPAVATSLTMREGLSFYFLDWVRLTNLYRGPGVALQMPEVLRGREVLNPRWLNLTGAMNVKVHVWTVNAETDMRRLLGMGVQGILTDYPDRLLRVMGREATAER